MSLASKLMAELRKGLSKKLTKRLAKELMTLGSEPDLSDDLSKGKDFRSFGQRRRRNSSWLVVVCVVLLPSTPEYLHSFSGLVRSFARMFVYRTY